MGTDAGWITSLREAGGVSSAGGKGAALGALVRAGFAVPDGFVVTTAAYDRFGAVAQGADAGAASEWEVAISDAYAALGGGSVAVRSSATAEDLPGASFAGQQDSYLNVTGADAVAAAVRRCWASLWNDRAVAYRAERGGPASGGRLSMAVVVQRLADADASGVMFTANPTNGRRDETVITASWGFGESIVGGRVDPDEYVIRGGDAGAPRHVTARLGAKAVMTVATDGGTAEVATPGPRRGVRVLTDAQALDLDALGRRIADAFGAPQDVEWVLAGDAWSVVQARPITALPDPVGPVPTAWPVPRPHSLYFRASIIEQMPDPLTPLFADLVRPAVPSGLTSLVRELAPSVEALDVDFPTINGYAFYDYSRAAFGQMLSFTPGALRLVLAKGFVLERWRDRELPRYSDAVAAWAARDPGTLTASDLVRGASELLAAGCLYYTTVQSVIPVASMAELTWTGLYDRLLRRPGDPVASDFLLGFDSVPILAEKSLADLASRCRRDEALSAALRDPAVDPLEDAPPDAVDADAWAGWREGLASHLATFGHLTYNLDWANPVPADDPTPILHALRHLLGGAASDPHERQARLAAERERLAAALFRRLDPARASVARRSLASAQAWAPIREDALAALGLAWPTMRRLLREAGRRLVDAGALPERDDVFWLHRAELDDLGPRADADERLASLADTLAERRATWRGQARATPPQYLPESGFLRSMDGMMPARTQADGPVLKGTTGSGGRVTGVARVLKGPADFAAFAPGEILVASITTPAYTPLFALAAGVVTDIGGVLSHGSIVAREYGIPAVLGTGAATTRIETGDVITVDGVSGEVRLAGAPDANPPDPSGAARPSVGVVLASVGAASALAGLGIAAARRRRPAR